MVYSFHSVIFFFDYGGQEADLAVAFLPILSDTRDFIKYSVTTLDEGEWIMLMRRPVISATGTGLLAPFTLNVWILILVSLLVVGPLIYGIIIIRWKLTGDKDQRLYPLPHCMWFVYGALMKQGSTLSPLAGKFIKKKLLNPLFRVGNLLKWIFIKRFNAPYVCNLVDFHHNINIILHGKFDGFSHIIQIHITDQFIG